MPKTNNDYQKELRARRVLLGQKRKEYYLTDSEAVQVSAFIKEIRTLTITEDTSNYWQ